MILFIVIAIGILIYTIFAKDYLVDCIKERKEYNMEYLYTSFNFVYKYILYIIANIRRFVKSFKMFTKCLQFTY